MLPFFVSFIWLSPPSLGPTNFIPNVVLWKPCSTSAQKVLSFVFATTTKICTQCWSKAGYPTPSTQHWRPPTYWVLNCYSIAKYRWYAWAPFIFGASPFGRWVVTHSLADFYFHDHRPAVYMNKHPLRLSDERKFRHLLFAFGWSRIASSAYQRRPTRRSHSDDNSIKQSIISYVFEVCEWLKDAIVPHYPKHHLYNIQLHHERLLSWEKFRRKPATRWFD